MKPVRRVGSAGGDGFTLVEIMIAMTILAIALVAALKSQADSISMESRSRIGATLCLLGQAKMAEIDSEEPAGIAPGRGDFGPDFPGYEWRLEVSDSGVRSLKRIDLTVSFGTKRDQRLDLVSYRCLRKEQG
ncbi:MAG: prepilin-type N-terminal cleavage/methylation domain-containing protein [Syntrophales bacterium]|nr:prepilin-type N-terminal cleavage/methylation domain-containing protein [Syntrophales bacterium]MDD5233137.1 prepilin-type N-terminal cleavage/methylation domain-containing protein [Syntrophales bacterium]MDD5531323.1 prepilin-type N-terminal cleavage/methylation domain-containing protein [Syntrophales bacterium]